MSGFQENNFSSKQIINNSLNLKNTGKGVSNLEEKLSIYLFNIQLLIAHKDYELAYNILRFCVSFYNQNEKILDLLYDMQLKTNRIREAELTSEENLKYNYSIKRSFLMANSHYLNQKDDEALKLYFDCLSNIEIEEEILFEIYKNIANIYVRFKEFDLAEEYYFKAYQIQSLSDVLLVNIGVLEYQKRDLEKSRECFRDALKLNKKNDKAWVGLAMTHLEFGDLELSLGNLLKALDENPENKTALVLLCQFYSKTEKNQVCRNYLFKYLEINNFDEDISLLLIQNFIHTQDFHEAYLESYKNYIWNPHNQENFKIYTELKEKLLL